MPPKYRFGERKEGRIDVDDSNIFTRLLFSPFTHLGIYSIKCDEKFASSRKYQLPVFAKLLTIRIETCARDKFVRDHYRHTRAKVANKSTGHGAYRDADHEHNAPKDILHEYQLLSL